MNSAVELEICAITAGILKILSQWLRKGRRNIKKLNCFQKLSYIAYAF